MPVAVVAKALLISNRLGSGNWYYRIPTAAEMLEGVRIGNVLREVSTTGLTRWYDGGAGLMQS